MHPTPTDRPIPALRFSDGCDHDVGQLCGHCTYVHDEFDGTTVITADARRRMSERGMDLPEQETFLAELNVDHTVYTTPEARQSMWLAGITSKAKQDALLARFGVDAVVVATTESTNKRPVDELVADATRGFPHTGTYVDADLTEEQMSDPRNVFGERHLEHVRAFYRRHGRLPTPLVLRCPDGSFVAPPRFRAELVRRLDAEHGAPVAGGIHTVEDAAAWLATLPNSEGRPTGKLAAAAQLPVLRKGMAAGPDKFVRRRLMRMLHCACDGDEGIQTAVSRLEYVYRNEMKRRRRDDETALVEFAGLLRWAVSVLA